MAIEKKLIHFGKLADFETQITAGNILDRSIVFIQDAKKIWTHGTYYDCSESVSPDADNVYITDFTVNDLENAESQSGVDADLTSLEEALAAHKVVLVPYDAGEGFLGYGLLLGYAEDLLYCTVYVGGFDGLFYEIEATRGDTFIRDQSILKRTWSDLQDRLVSGTNIKTINGTSILGIGNIEIESGEDNVQSDWNVTDTSSDAYIKHKPTIPTKTSQLTNDSNFLDKDTADGSYIAVKKFGEIDFVAQAQALDDRVLLYAFPTSATGDEDDVIATKNTLKTINGESILGEGDLTVEGGAKVYNWTMPTDDNGDVINQGNVTQEEFNAIENADILTVNNIVASKIGSAVDGVMIITMSIVAYNAVALYNILIEKQSLAYQIFPQETPIPTATSQLENDSNFVSSDGLKTINGESIVGSGDIVVGKTNYVELSGASVTISTMLENTFYYDTTSLTNLTISAFTSSGNPKGEYKAVFKAADGMSLTLPSDVYWANGTIPDIEANVLYELSIERGLDIYKAVLVPFKSVE